MAKYETKTGIPCTPKEEKLIDSLKRLAKKWDKDGSDLILFSWSGSLVVAKISADTTGHFEDAVLESIYGITNDGGDPD